MEDPDWAKILDYLYKQERALDCRLVNEYNNTEIIEESLENHEIVKETDLLPSEIADTIQFLVDQNLCRMDNRADLAPDVSSRTNYRKTTVSITPDGFDVAHDREIAKSQQETNERSARLSAYLVIGIIIQALASFTDTDGLIVSVLYSILILGLLTLVLIDLGPSVLERGRKI